MIHRQHDLIAAATAQPTLPPPAAFAASLAATHAAAVAWGASTAAAAGPTPPATAYFSSTLAAATRASSVGAPSPIVVPNFVLPLLPAGVEGGAANGSSATSGGAHAAAPASAASHAPSSSRGGGLRSGPASSTHTAASLEVEDAAATSIPGATVGGAAGGVGGSSSGPTALLSSASSTTTTTTPVAKQGAYGKVRIHVESKLAQLSHLDEVWAAVLFKLGVAGATRVAPLPAGAPPARRFVERMLARTSRSFAMVIQQLPDHLRESVAVFYLVLRGLDTVEDDMVSFVGREAEKLRHLRAFHEYLYDPYFAMTGVRPSYSSRSCG